MAEQVMRDLVRPETTETLQAAPTLYQLCNKGGDLHQGNVDSFRKKVTKGSLHHLPQSVICIPVHFIQAHRDTFKLGNLITLEGPSGNTWKVRATGRPILHSGWRAFAHDHELCEGDELCFTLTQPLYFVVTVWNRFGVVKESALTATNTGMYTVASVRYPYEYVHRKRRGRTSTFHGNHISYGVPASATIASRCKTTARERSAMLRFSHRSKQWECRKDKDGREVVTILDSDDDDADEEKKHLLDHLELSFGSAQVQSYRMSKIQRLLAYMKTQGDFIPAPVAAMAVGTQTAHEIANRHAEELKVAETVVDSEAAAELIRKQQAQVSPDDDTTMMSEIEALNLPRLAAQPNRDEQLLITPETILCAELKTQVTSANQDTVTMPDLIEAHTPRLLAVQPDHDERPLRFTPETILCAELKTQVSYDEDTTMTLSEKEAHLELDHDVQPEETILVLQSHTIPTAEHESVPVDDPLTVEKGNFLPPATERGTDSLYETLQNIVDIPVITDTVININTVGMREEPASRSPEHKKSRDLSIKQSLGSASKQQHCEMAMTKMVKPPGRGSSKGTGCVLKSKRMAVAKLVRAKTLRAAQAMTKKLRSPNFVAVMKSCNVYSGFSMDIPAEFGKRSRLPAAEARVTLVCDEVPTICKAVWIGTNPEKPKLDAHAWMEFSRSHFLEEGDVCVFELFNRVTIRIGIHIFRLVGLSRSLLPAHWTQHYNVVHLDAPHSACSDTLLTPQP